MKPFFCHHCGHQFDRKSNVGRHIINNHLNSRKHKAQISCPYCQSHFSSFKSLDVHQNQMHSKQVEVREYSFKNEPEFHDWKETEQISSQAQFFVHQTYLTKKGERVKQFLCSRSGTYKSSRPIPERKRPQSNKGSRKIGSICPARMIATFSNDCVNVKYYPNHRPHDNNLCHLSLPKREEKLLADKIKNGVRMNKILEEIRNECVSSTDLQIKHFVKRKTLNNIKRKYNILSSVKINSKDETNVAELLNECKKNGKNPFLIFKKSNEQHDLLNIDDVFAIIMTEAQKEVLVKCSDEQICIDCISDIKYDYQLVTIEVIDEFGEVFPCAFCITSCINDFTMSLFFNLVKNEIGRRIETKLFLSDDNPSYYNAWRSVMTEVKSTFLNKWYVDKNFRNSLRGVTNKRNKCEIYSYLRSLLDETDALRFSRLLEEFLKNLNKKEYHEFFDFFLSTYAYRLHNWALCYRDTAFLGVSIVLEKFHKLLEQIFAQFVKNQRLDIMLYHILKVIRDKTFDRRIGLEEGHVNHYIENIIIRHQRAKQVISIEKVGENEWLVESVRTRGLKYQVKSEKSITCDCKMKCPKCKTCVHEFYCTCHDYLLSNYLCKHVHAVNIHDTLTPPSSANDDEDSMMKVLTCEGVYENVTIPTSQHTEEISSNLYEITPESISFDDIIPIEANSQLWQELYNPNETSLVYICEPDVTAGFLCDDIELPVILDGHLEGLNETAFVTDPTNPQMLLDKMENICSILKTKGFPSVSDQIEIDKRADEILNLLVKQDDVHG